MSGLLDKTYACLLGGAVGEALGTPVKGMHYRDIDPQEPAAANITFEKIEDNLLHTLLCRAILENDGHITADEFADSFLKNTKAFADPFPKNPDKPDGAVPVKKEKNKGYYASVRNMYHKIENKLALPVYAGLGNMQSSSSAVCIPPMGVINACNPRQAAMEAYEAAGLLHAGDTTFCRDGASAVAAAVAEAMKPDATVESVVWAATGYLHKTSSAEMSRCITEAVAMAKKTGEYPAFREKFHRELLQKVSGDPRETVPCALALFYLSGGSIGKAVLQAAHFGRAADMTGTMTGALCGAFKGISGFPEEWVPNPEASASHWQELSEKLTAVALRRIHAQKECIDLFLQIAAERKSIK